MLRSRKSKKFPPALVDQEPITAIDEPRKRWNFLKVLQNLEPSEIIEPVAIIEESQIEEVPHQHSLPRAHYEIEEPEEAEEFLKVL